mgnify:CR=1 FL=1
MIFALIGSFALGIQIILYLLLILGAPFAAITLDGTPRWLLVASRMPTGSAWCCLTVSLASRTRMMTAMLSMCLPMMLRQPLAMCLWCATTRALRLSMP